ncbi:MAG: hypothetical protein MI674_04680, partial [Cytophagales bacterium]|nr:hypothetical protein [Cytophagales bacterium]
LRPNTSPHPEVSWSVGFNLLISGHAATQATGFGLLTWQVYLLLKMPAFAGHTTKNQKNSTIERYEGATN